MAQETSQEARKTQHEEQKQTEEPFCSGVGYVKQDAAPPRTGYLHNPLDPTTLDPQPLDPQPPLPSTPRPTNPSTHSLGQSEFFFTKVELCRLSLLTCNAIQG